MEIMEKVKVFLSFEFDRDKKLQVAFIQSELTIFFRNRLFFPDKKVQLFFQLVCSNVEGKDCLT